MGESPEAIVIWATAATVMITNKMMIMMRVGRRTAEG